MALKILILLNLCTSPNAEVFLLRRRPVKNRQHVMVIKRNKRPVERSFVIVRCTDAHYCENIASLIKKFNLPMEVFSLKFLN